MIDVLYFLKKELMESWRHYRVMILGLVFLLFGIESPLIAKITPDLLKAVGGQLKFSLPNPTSIQAWQQFFKNMTQIGIYLLAAITSNTVSQEVSRGTLVNLISKGLPRYAIIIAKYVMAMLLWFGAILFSFLVTWVYTAYYFPDHYTPHVWLGVLPLLLFGFLFMAITIFGSTLTRSDFVGFFIAVGAAIFLTLLGFIKHFKRWNPISLVSDNMAITQGTEHFTRLIPAYAATLVLASIFIIWAVQVLNYKKL